MANLNQHSDMNSTIKTSVVSLHHFKISNFIDKHKFS